MIPQRRLAAHERLLVQFTQRAEVRAPLGDESALLEDSTCRERLIRLASRHGVHGLVVSTLARSPLMRSLSSEVAEAFTASLGRLRRQAVLWDLERDRLLTLLDRNGWTPIILKGGALRETVYDEPAARAIADLDLLLPADQVDGALHALESVGYRIPGQEEAAEAYRRHHFHFVLTHPNGFVVELHWALSRAGQSFHLDERAFFARIVERRHASGLVLRIPSAEDMILHMAAQNDDDGFGQLRRFVDVDRIVVATPQLDWSYLRQAASTARLQGFVALALRLSQHVFRTPVPIGFVDSLGLAALSRLNLALLRPVPWVITRHGNRYTAAAEVMLFWTTVGWRDRLRQYSAIALAQQDPLAWLWAHKPPARWRQLRGLSAIGKLAAYQLGVYGSGLAASLTPSGRAGLRFWRDRLPGSLADPAAVLTNP